MEKLELRLPWQIQGEHIVDSRGLFVAKIGKTGHTAMDAEHEQIQAYIVHAVNLYNVLLTAVCAGLRCTSPMPAIKQLCYSKH